MRKPSDRNILEAVEQQVNAMLLFTCIECGVGKLAPSRRPTYWRRRQHLKGLMEIADLLAGRIDEWPICEGCQEPIRARQAYVASDDGVWQHAKCAGYPASKCTRMESPADVRREMRRYADDARAYLRSKGAIA